MGGPRFVESGKLKILRRGLLVGMSVGAREGGGWGCGSREERMLSYAGVRLYINHSRPWNEMCTRHERGVLRDFPTYMNTLSIVGLGKRKDEIARRTSDTLPHNARMTQVVLICGHTNPVPPANLPLHDSYRLVARVVSEIFEEYPTSEYREMYRAYTNHNLSAPPYNCYKDYEDAPMSTQTLDSFWFHATSRMSRLMMYPSIRFQ